MNLKSGAINVWVGAGEMKLTLDNLTAVRVKNEIAAQIDVTVSVEGNIMSVSGKPDKVDEVHWMMQRYIPILCRLWWEETNYEDNMAKNKYRFF